MRVFVRVLVRVGEVKVFVRHSEGESAQRASEGGCESKHASVGECEGVSEVLLS